MLQISQYLWYQFAYNDKKNASRLMINLNTKNKTMNMKMKGELKRMKGDLVLMEMHSDSFHKIHI